MIVGLKESTPYVIKSSPKTKTDANWFKTELLDSLEIFSAFVSGLSFLTIVHRMCLVSRNCWNMSTRIWMNYICCISP